MHASLRTGFANLEIERKYLNIVEILLMLKKFNLSTSHRAIFLLSITKYVSLKLLALIYLFYPSTDVEAAYGGFSPRQAVDSLRCTPPIQLGQCSKFMEGFRRRTRQRSLNIPCESLDEDLGFPPVCSPPPEVFGPIASSSPDGGGLVGFRNRSISDAHPGMTVVHKRQSGVLVIFPQSPSHHDGMGNLARTGLGVTCSSKSFDGSLPATPRDGRSSPRRPLYVDTQLANGLIDKRRSPVASVVDFVRGRNRTTSLNFSGPGTPPSPQPITARASASVDGGMSNCKNSVLIFHISEFLFGTKIMVFITLKSPLFSPMRSYRPPLSRLYRPGMRSLDSGLDLSSPTIGHTALLIKEFVYLYCIIVILYTFNEPIVASYFCLMECYNMINNILKSCWS
uniref:Uncharacterized protein n=1 Tax=Heterorhabditis bacteriophora TaxID=37862 RepID=A0A1I7WPA8_HETBA